MDSRNRSRPSADQHAVITAPTLKGAYKLVKQTYGEDAVILGSRTVTRRQPHGLGHEKFVEVTVQAPGRAASPAASIPAPAAGGSLSADQVLSEVSRIENLVAEIAEEFTRRDGPGGILAGNPLAQNFLDAGTSEETVQKLLTRFLSETGQRPDNRAGALAWLTENLKASNCEWDGFYGCHAFLGPRSSDSFQMILSAAARLQKLGRRTLVLSVMPPHHGRVKQLQVEAARLGFDAAIIQKPQQLTRSEKHLGRYDVVLVDMPTVEHPQMDQGRILHGWLSGNTTFHRHMVVPSFYDPADMDSLREAARDWNCDWLALTGLEATRRPGKVLEFVDRIPLPLSLVGWDGHLEIASSGALLDFVLGQPLGASYQEKQAGGEG